MVVEYTKRFLKDIDAIDNRSLALDVKEAINDAKSVNSIKDLKSTKKMKGEKNAFRIKIGDYRLGFYLEADTILMSRFLHRKEIYRYFP
ncbi:MAG: plasmid stabilization protein [Bacteroidetes bacterium RIFOXYA12_FULL_35_11]|nr:MAG: plasmid stabilization protein [Bacteroidetes bacterium GWF2_35_48]OFY80188.1 MAG: plasmid stabilization protein [Bacteroidetes bacterium RIFOXYA12_FULL_35_11]OFY93513.1 MAG: plasmid stabilization protein [Bacteroidetes bacterium RIFOXYC12_FULL_35_7]OFY94574.1 MAG: plasmid stabilization protein [Bacteroidetes bacterium RIFOXYB2_FULL_35_7]HBX51732.1 plasmid stabilization protein [Bacteroidales bacterium]